MPLDDHVKEALSKLQDSVEENIPALRALREESGIEDLALQRVRFGHRQGRDLVVYDATLVPSMYTTDLCVLFRIKKLPILRIKKIHPGDLDESKEIICRPSDIDLVVRARPSDYVVTRYAEPLSETAGGFHAFIGGRRAPPEIHKSIQGLLRSIPRLTVDRDTGIVYNDPNRGTPITDKEIMMVIAKFDRSVQLLRASRIDASPAQVPLVVTRSAIISAFTELYHKVYRACVY